MKRLIAVVLAVVLLASMSGVVLAEKPPKAIDNGNGAPSGPHFTLNIIGVPHAKANNAENLNKWTSGHRIFVLLDEDGTAAATGKYGTKILLKEAPAGESYAVLDANGTDNNGAAFQLPNPDPDGDGTTAYSVYIRALGTPGGSAKMQTCYTDDTGTWCAVDFGGGVSIVEVERSNGKSKFENVSKDLLYVDYCTSWESDGLNLPDPPYEAGDTCLAWDVFPLFGAPTIGLAEYFWDYDNQGLKLAQLRFYEIPTEAWPGLGD
ncbi:hypothetical protein ACFLTP_10385 [Chloroflexota bacterium]